jgi:hypothetical protein
MKFLKGTVVKHPKVDWGKGVVLEDTSGPTIKIRFEKVGLKTLSLAHIQPIPLDEPMVAETEIARLEQMGRVYIDETFKDIYDDIKSRYPDHIVVIQNGYYGWKLYERQAGVTITGFPDQVEKAWRDLRAKNTPYILVSQLDLREGGKVQRTISEIFPDQA